ncbi:Two-component response regulator [Dokdonella koreensis DS-123]|uniref:Two-component response regulator n=2 Tax=Dokdonella TaxID=323413 RepID=A0A160DRV5_9GAMM|nr:Two-component response regulator [Dokdonella koreensis DS-123]
MLATSFDLLLLDIGLSGESGLDVARRVRAAYAVGIVMLTGRGSRHEQITGLRESADAWLVKPTEIEVVAATLSSVAWRLRRHGMAARKPARERQWVLDAEGWQLFAPDERCVALNLPERLVLARLFATPGEAVQRQELIACVTSTLEDFDSRRLEMLIHRLRRRVLDQIGASLPVRAVRGRGYVALVSEGQRASD